MHLNRLCFILPAKTQDINPVNNTKTPENINLSDHHLSCGNQVLNLIKRFIRRFLTPKNVPKNHVGSFFEDTAGVDFFDKVGGDNPRVFTYAELYIGSNGFSEDELLGSGGFGRVYRAVLPSDNSVVAVKCLNETGERFEKTFEAELAAVAHLRHRHLVRLRGWCVNEGHLLLVYDYMPNRSLDRVLFRRMENPVPVLTWQNREKILHGLAAALYYLHEQLENQIVHRDVKTSNVMLDSNYNAKLGDFGLARWQAHELEYQNQTPLVKNYEFHLAETTKTGGTIGYLPPESFQKRGVATAKSDVFSFGVVMMEVVSGRRAVDLAYPDDQIILLDWIRRLSDEGIVIKARDDRVLEGTYCDDDVTRLVHIGLLCTLHGPQSRPNMKWVMEALSGNMYGRLPDLPSFKNHPMYITWFSSSSATTSITITTETATTTTGSNTLSFVTASDNTIYETAEKDNSVDVVTSSNQSLSRKRSFFMVETPREISFREIIAATDNFSDSKKVAELDFGTAYRGILGSHCHVLIKRLGMKTCPALRERFANELQNLGRLRHRHLVHLHGWCTEQGEMLVIYDYSSSCLLSNLLFYHDREKDTRICISPLTWHRRYNIIKSLVCVILYLHEEWEEQVIHRNITSSAVIIGPDMNPRLSSFALAEFLTRNEHGNPHVVIDKKKSVRGIFGYMSPEYMESGDATPAADVYSFGVVLLEIVTGQMAVDFRRPEVLLVKRVHEFEAQKRPYEELADWKLNGEYDDVELERVINLGLACTQSNPESRPSMRQIVCILDGNDQWFWGEGKKQESKKEWRHKNTTSLSLIRSIQALGIQ